MNRITQNKGNIAGVAVLLTFSWLVFFTPKFYMTSGVYELVNYKNIKSINIGDSQAQVIALLGNPLKEVRFDDRTHLYYSNPIWFAYTQPRVWIVLENEKVSRVWVEEMILWGDDHSRSFYDNVGSRISESDDFYEVFRIRTPQANQ